MLLRLRKDSWNSLNTDTVRKRCAHCSHPYLEWSHLRIHQYKPKLCDHILCPTLCLGYCTLSVEDDLQLDAKTCKKKDILHLVYTTSIRNICFPFLQLNNLKDRQFNMLACSTSVQSESEWGCQLKAFPSEQLLKSRWKEPICLYLEFSGFEVFYFPVF